MMKEEILCLATKLATERCEFKLSVKYHVRYLNFCLKTSVEVGGKKKFLPQTDRKSRN